MTSTIEISPTPPDWVWSQLAELSTGVFDCPHSTPKLTGAGPYVVRTQDIATGVFRPGNAAHVSEDTYRERISRAEPRPGDLLYSREGTYFGVAAEVPSDTLVCLGQRMVLIRPDASAVDCRYLRHWLNSAAMSAYVEGHKDGSVAQRLNLPTIRALPVPVPSLREQARIAETLGALENKVESNLRSIGHAHALLDLYSAKFAAQLHGVVPLSELADVTRETVSPTRLGETAVDHFSIPAFDEAAWPERVPASTIMSNKLLVRRPSILLSRLNPRFNRTWWAVPTDGVTAMASTEFLVASSADPADFGALWLALRDEFFKTELMRRVTGTSGSHQRIRPDDVLAIEVPDVRMMSVEAKKCALALLTVIHQRRSENRRLIDLRDSLLPELLSGRIRVPEAPELAQEGVA